MSAQVQATTVGDRLAERARLHPHRVMFRLGDETRTYGEMGQRAVEVAAGLTAVGLRKGDRIAVLAEHTLQAWELILACARTGVVPVLLNFRLTPADLGLIVADAGCRVLLSTVRFAPLAAAVPTEPGVARHELDSFVASCVDGSAADIAVQGGDDLVQLYTSGTTGLPKGVRSTHDNLWQLSLAASSELAGFAADAVHLVAAPLFHIAGFAYGLGALATGSASVLVPMFDPVAVVRAIETYRCTNTLLVPAMLQAIVEHPDTGSADLSSMRGILYGGSPMSVALLRKVASRFDCGLSQTYGLTETSGFATLLRFDDHAAGLAAPAGSPLAARITSAGYPVPGCEVSVVLENGASAEDGTSGEVVVRGPLVMAGYWNRPELNAAVIDADGWFHTGDVGYLSDGYLFLVDRLNDMVVTKGENVFPGEVERVLAEHPAVLEVAVIGVPDAQYGELLCAVVVLRPGHELTLSDVRDFCRDRLAGFKLPRRLEITPEPLPRTPSGKALRHVIRQPFWAGLERQIH